MKRLLLAAVILLSACSNADGEQVAIDAANGDVGTSCTAHEDCVVPPEYLLRSSCAYMAQCIQGRCAVTCPMMVHAQNAAVSRSYFVGCKYKDHCACDSYPASDLKHCACVDGMCMAVAAE